MPSFCMQMSSFLSSSCSEKMLILIRLSWNLPKNHSTDMHELTSGPSTPLLSVSFFISYCADFFFKKKLISFNNIFCDIFLVFLHIRLCHLQTDHFIASILSLPHFIALARTSSSAPSRSDDSRHLFYSLF